MTSSFIDALTKAATPAIVDSNTQTNLTPAAQQATAFGNQPYLLGVAPMHFETWHRGFVSSTHNFIFNFYVPEYWIRVVKAVAHVQPLHATVPNMTFTGTDTNSGHPESSPGVPELNTDNEGGHRHVWFKYIADAAAFTNRNGTGYTSVSTTGISIPESSAADLWTIDLSTPSQAGDHHHKFDHIHLIELTSLTGASDDVVDSPDAAADLGLYINSNLIQSGISTPTDVDISAALTNTSASPAIPVPGTYEITLGDSTKFGEVEVVIEVYVVTRPPVGAF